MKDTFVLDVDGEEVTCEVILGSQMTQQVKNISSIQITVQMKMIS